MDAIRAARPAGPLPTLWLKLMELLRSQRLTITSLHRLSQVSRPEIYTIKKGRVPFPQTLDDLARGLATDPYTGRVDPALYRRFYRVLWEAAGYPPGPAGAGDALAQAIREAVGDDADAVEDFLWDLGNLAPDDLSLVLDSLKALHTRFGTPPRRRGRDGPAG